MTAGPGSSVQPPTLKPAIAPSVHLGLTIVYTVIYGLLFLIVYIQLWMILCYKHKRLSYQTVFLFLCLAWAGLRTVLFSFYFMNTSSSNNLDTFVYWLLFCCPVCLQYVTVCLLLIFFAQVLFRGKPHHHEESRLRKPLWLAISLSIVIFLATNVTCAIIVKQYDFNSDSPPDTVSFVRVSINDSLFVIVGVALSVCIYNMSKMASSSVVLEAKGTTVRQALVACVLIIILYSSRAFYNFVAIARLNHIIDFGYDWINVSDQAEFVNLQQGPAFISFGVVLFIWEFLPTFIVVMFFRVQKPNSATVFLSSLPSESFDSPAYFFDNPRRYDSEDDENGGVMDHVAGMTPGERSYLIQNAASPAPVTIVTTDDQLEVRRPRRSRLLPVSPRVPRRNGMYGYSPTPQPQFYDGT